MKTGAIVAVTTHGGATADTATVQETVIEAAAAVAEIIAEKTPEGTYPVDPLGVEEVVADKGYHSNDVAVGLKEMGVRSMWLNRIAVLATGVAKRPRRPRCMPTGGASKASVANDCSGNAGNGSSATSRISSIAAVWTGFMCEA